MCFRGVLRVRSRRPESARSQARECAVAEPRVRSHQENANAMPPYRGTRGGSFGKKLMGTEHDADGKSCAACPVVGIQVFGVILQKEGCKSVKNEGEVRFFCFEKHVFRYN